MDWKKSIYGIALASTAFALDDTPKNYVEKGCARMEYVLHYDGREISSNEEIFIGEGFYVAYNLNVVCKNVCVEDAKERKAIPFAAISVSISYLDTKDVYYHLNVSGLGITTIMEHNFIEPPSKHTISCIVGTIKAGDSTLKDMVSITYVVLSQGDDEEYDVPSDNLNNKRIYKEVLLSF